MSDLSDFQRKVHEPTVAALERQLEEARTAVSIAREALNWYAKQSWMDDANPEPAKEALARLSAARGGSKE